MLAGEGTKPGQLALAVYCQLEADVDDALAAQAVKCLVHLSKDMLEVDREVGLLLTALQPGQRATAVHIDDTNGHPNHGSPAEELDYGQNGAQAADSEGESGSEEEQQVEKLGHSGAPGLTLQGLVRRMTKMAGDRSDKSLTSSIKYQTNHKGTCCTPPRLQLLL